MMYDAVVINNAERCPVCKRKPRIIRASDTLVRLECRPWYRRKPHLSTGNIYSKYYFDSLEKAAKIWDRKADCANLPVW